MRTITCCCLALMAVVSGTLVLPRTDPRPDCAIRIEPEELNRGDIRQESVPFAFVIRNEGRAPVTIRALPSSCACNVTRLDKSVLQPSEAATLSGELDGKKFRAGRMRVPIRFEYDCAGKTVPAQAMLAGTVVPHVTASPEFIRFREHGESQTLVRIQANYAPEIEIVEVSCTNTEIEVRLSDTSATGIEVRVRPEANVSGRDITIRHAEILVQTTSPAMPLCKVPVAYVGVREAATE